MHIARLRLYHTQRWIRSFLLNEKEFESVDNHLWSEPSFDDISRIPFRSETGQGVATRSSFMHSSSQTHLVAL